MVNAAANICKKSQSKQIRGEDSQVKSPQVGWSVLLVGMDKRRTVEQQSP